MQSESHLFVQSYMSKVSWSCKDFDAPIDGASSVDKCGKIDLYKIHFEPATKNQMIAISTIFYVSIQWSIFPLPFTRSLLWSILPGRITKTSPCCPSDSQKLDPCDSSTPVNSNLDGVHRMLNTLQIPPCKIERAPLHIKNSCKAQDDSSSHSSRIIMHTWRRGHGEQWTHGRHVRVRPNHVSRYHALPALTLRTNGASILFQPWQYLSPCVTQSIGWILSYTLVMPAWCRTPKKAIKSALKINHMIILWLLIPSAPKILFPHRTHNGTIMGNRNLGSCFKSAIEAIIFWPDAELGTGGKFQNLPW